MDLDMKHPRKKNMKIAHLSAIPITEARALHTKKHAFYALSMKVLQKMHNIGIILADYAYLKIIFRTKKPGDRSSGHVLR